MNRNPRNVRPSWVDVDISDRQTRLSGGPRGRRGHTSAKFFARVLGEVTDVLSVQLVASNDGKSVTLVVTDTVAGKTILDRSYTQ